MMNKIHKTVMKLTNGYASLFSFIIFLLFVIFILPFEAQKSEALGLIASPDTSFFYTSADLYNIASDYGIIGRKFYIEQRFTFDIIWPIIYGLFLLTSSTFFYKKSRLVSHSFFIYVSVIPVIFDYFENAMTSIVMYRYPNKTLILDNLAGFMTLFKWTTLGIAFLVLIVLTVIYILQLFKCKKMHT